MRGYYYLFYKLFIFWEKISFPKFWSAFKAEVSIMALEIWLVMSVVNYYTVFIDRHFYLNKIVFMLIVVCIVIVNLRFFTYSSAWKDYNVRFERLSKNQNLIGGIIVWCIICMIILNFIYSFYLLYQLD